jgi:hypothetical protein
MRCHVVDFQVHFCSLLGTSTLSFLILIRHILCYIYKKLFARLHNKYEFLIITLTLSIFCFLIGSYLIHFKFFYLFSFFFLPEVTPFRCSIVPNGSTILPFHRTGTCYLQVPRISTWSNVAQLHLSRCDQKHYASSRTLLVNVLIN